MASKKLTTKKSSVTVNDGDTKDNKSYVVVDPTNGSTSKMLTGKAAVSREARKWVGDNYYGGRSLFIAEIVGRVQKRNAAVNDVPVIEV